MLGLVTCEKEPEMRARWNPVREALELDSDDAPNTSVYTDKAKIKALLLDWRLSRLVWDALTHP